MSIDSQPCPVRADVPAGEPGEGWPRQAPEFRALDAAWQPMTDASKLDELGAGAADDPAKLITQLNSARVQIDRHTSPSLIDQLTQSMRRPIDTVLCCALDIDPTTRLNSALAANYALELLAGALAVSRATKAPRCSILLDARAPSRWFTTLCKASRQRRVSIELIINDYPQADPTLLVYTMRGRRLRPGRLPSEAGVLILDAAAAISVGRATTLGQPMTQVPLAIRDHAGQRCDYVLAGVGSTLSAVCEKVGLSCDSSILRVGSLLRDQRVTGDYSIGSGELLVHLSAPATAVNPTPCVRCGWCLDACPTRVHPATALEASQRSDAAMAELAGVEACIECGICAYVCPSHLPLLDGIRRVKQVLKRGQAAEGSDS